MSRGKELLLYKANTYFENRTLESGEVKWSSKKTCGAWLKTYGRSTNLTDGYLVHTHHSKTNQEIVKLKFTGAVKRKAAHNPSVRPSKIFRGLIDVQCSETFKTRDINNVKQAEKEAFPRLPHSVAEVQSALQTMNLETVRKEPFLLVNDLESNITVFSTVSNLSALCKSQVVFVDGTFEYCARHFLQMFSIHGFLNGHYIPLVFAVLKDKREETYKYCLSIIHDVCAEHQLEFSPKTLDSDLEKGIQNAFSNVFPQIAVVACRFHVGLRHGHPPIFRFVNVLLAFQNEIYIKLNSINEPFQYQNPLKNSVIINETY